MEEAKKPKRPRIGTQGLGMPSDSAEHETRYEKVNYPSSAAPAESSETGDQQAHHGYQQRNYGYQQRQGGYQQRPYQQRQAAYQQRPYQQRTQPYGQQTETGEAGEQTAQQGGYQRQTGYQRQGGYNNQNRQGGYNNQNRQGGYNNQNRQGGYNSQNRQGGYNNQNRQGGYNNQNRQGGYNSQNRQGGYNNQNRQGGYNNQNRQGGYNNQNRQGGYNSQNRQGGYNNRQGGFNRQNGNQNRQGGFNNQNRNWKNNSQQGGMRFMPRPKQIDYVLEDIDPNAEMRLNKYMANAGICSRREADEYITGGKVKVNGEVVTELGTKITRNDVVEYDDKVVTPERKCYVLLNKPKDCVTTSDDPNGRTTVLDIVKNACEERIYPVGRLDRNTTGVLLLTNDGDLAAKLTHPKFVKKKIYHVWTDKDITEEDMQRIADGIELEDGEIHADAISYVSDDRNQAGIEIHSGRNRIVRRIFEHLGYRVVKLDRVYFAGLTKKNLPRGRWRYLTQEEVNYLRMGAFE